MLKLLPSALLVSKVADAVLKYRDNEDMYAV